MSEIRHSEKENRFYETVSGGEAELCYKKSDGTLKFVSTFVPEESRERGVAARIVEEGFRYAKEHGLKVDPVCPYVGRTFLSAHPEWKNITV